MFKSYTEQYTNHFMWVLILILHNTDITVKNISETENLDSNVLLLKTNI